MTLQNRYNYLPYFWAMTSFLKVLTHAKNIDNHWSSAAIHYFECMVRKTFYSCFLWLRNKKVINFQIFHTLFQKKCWPQQKLWYLAKNVPTIWCRPVWSIFAHNFVTIEQKLKKWTRRGGSPMDPSPPTYLTSKKSPTPVVLMRQTDANHVVEIVLLVNYVVAIKIQAFLKVNIVTKFIKQRKTLNITLKWWYIW